MNLRQREPRVWVVMADGRNTDDLRDLDHFDSILWGANPHAKKGDLLLLYRTAPFSDIAYLFTAGNDARPTNKSDRADTTHVIQLTDKIRLTKPLSLAFLRANKTLAGWSFARQQQGVMRHRQDITAEGIWPALRRLLESRNPATTSRAQQHSKQTRNTTTTDNSQTPKDFRLRVFLSYSADDHPRVHRLYRRLLQEGWLDLWFDKTQLTTGDDWEDRIREGLHTADAIIICMSARSVVKVGILQTEIKRALELADQQPEGTTFILPAKLEPCTVPNRLARWQYTELFNRHGYTKLLAGLKRRARFLTEHHQKHRH